MSRKLTVLALAMLALCMASVARADSFDLNVIYCNCLLQGASAGTVTIASEAANSVTFTVSLNTGLQFHDAGLTSFAFNGPAGLTAANFTGLPDGWNLATDQNKLAMNSAGAGNFMYYLDCTAAPNGCDPNISTLTFTITGLSSTALTQFETLGSANVDFAANVAVANASGCTGIVGGGNGTGESTASGGYAAGSTRQTECAPTPEPTSIAFFGTGLLALGFVIRKRFVSQS